MSPGEWVETLKALGGDIGAGSTARKVDGTLAEALPPDHRELLRRLNGLTVYHGAFRLFGIDRDKAVLDLDAWNARETWRFAWDDRTDPYLIFGETAWGDQYAYRWEEPRTIGQEIIFLEGTLLRPQVIAGSFQEFMMNEFLRNADNPYDELTVETVRRCGPISVEKHWVYTPSVALGGVESIDNVMEMPAITAMTFAGDVASALRSSRPGTFPSAVTPWTDALGRSRLRVGFE